MDCPAPARFCWLCDKQVEAGMVPSTDADGTEHFFCCRDHRRVFLELNSILRLTSGNTAWPGGWYAQSSTSL